MEQETDKSYYQICIVRFENGKPKEARPLEWGIATQLAAMQDNLNYLHKLLERREKTLMQLKALFGEEFDSVANTVIDSQTSITDKTRAQIEETKNKIIPHYTEVLERLNTEIEDFESEEEEDDI